MIGTFDKLRDQISASEWLAIIRGDEDGQLPPCCANVSELRDALTKVATVAGYTAPMMWETTAILLEREIDGGHIPEESMLAHWKDDLVSVLIRQDENWRVTVDDWLSRRVAQGVPGRVLANELSRAGVHAMADGHGWVEVLGADHLLDLLRDPVRSAGVVAGYESMMAEIGRLAHSGD